MKYCRSSTLLIMLIFAVLLASINAYHEIAKSELKQKQALASQMLEVQKLVYDYIAERRDEVRKVLRMESDQIQQILNSGGVDRKQSLTSLFKSTLPLAQNFVIANSMGGLIIKQSPLLSEQQSLMNIQNFARLKHSLEHVYAKHSSEGNSLDIVSLWLDSNGQALGYVMFSYPLLPLQKIINTSASFKLALIAQDSGQSQKLDIPGSTLSIIPLGQDHSLVDQKTQILWRNLAILVALMIGLYCIYIGLNRFIRYRNGPESNDHSSAKLRRQLNSMTWKIDLDGSVLSVGSYIEKATGYQANEMTSLNMEDLIPADQNNKLPMLFNDLRKGPVTEQLQIKNKDGSLGHWWIWAVMERDDNDYDYVRGIAINHSIYSAERNHMVGLQAVFETILKSLPVIYYRIDKDFCFSEFEGAGMHSFGVHRENIIGSAVEDKFPTIWNVIDKIRSKGNYHLETAHDYIGRRIWFSHFIFVNPYDQQELIGFATDISYLKVSLKELEKLNGEKRQLTQKMLEVEENIRHSLANDLHDEVGQSLTAIRSNAAVMLSTNSTDPALYKKHAEFILDIATDSYEIAYGLMYKLRPSSIDNMGIEIGLKSCIKTSGLEKNGVNVDFMCKGDLDSIEELTKITLYRILQEALTNIAKYASARNVEISFIRETLVVPGRRKSNRKLSDITETDIEAKVMIEIDSLKFYISDDGIGFPDNHYPGMGLQGMCERMQALGGEIEIAGYPGKGVSIHGSLDIKVNTITKKAR